MIANPSSQLDPASNGNGYPATNYSLELHPNQLLNYLYLDGHIEARNPYDPDMYGAEYTGTQSVPKGKWTVTTGD